jgi:hypothetical protein
VHLLRHAQDHHHGESEPGPPTLQGKNKIKTILKMNRKKLSNIENKIFSPAAE